MTEEPVTIRGVYEVVNIPLGANLTEKEIRTNARICVAGKVPISVLCRINDRSAPQIDLATYRALSLPIERLYLTTTTTSTNNLELIFSNELEVTMLGLGASVTLVDSAGAIYDPRTQFQENVLDNTTNINTGTTEYTGEITTTGYNKLTGWVFADRALTVYIYTYQATGGTRRQVDTVAVAASTGTAFEIPVVAGIMELGFNNASGVNTATCEKQVDLRSGA